MLCTESFALYFLKVSVPGLERALEQYVTNGEYDKSFDLKVVPISALPLSVTEVKKPSLSVETVTDKKEKKASRQEIYAGHWNLYTYWLEKKVRD